MSERVTMPALGESVTEGTVTRWLKSVGDTVEVDEPLLEVSTDKVDTEIPSPVAGTLQEILAEEDETVEVGADLAVIGDGETTSSDDSGSDEAAAESQDESPAAGDDSAEAGEGEGTLDANPDTGEDADGSAGAEDGGSEPAPESEPDPEPSGDDSGSGDGGSGDGETVTMPALGESVTEGTVTRWLKSEGDHVEVDEPLLEVSTDKVDTEIPSPVAGTLTKILVSEDDTVEVGGDLAIIGGSGGGSESSAASADDSEDTSTPEPEPEATEEPETGEDLAAEADRQDEAAKQAEDKAQEEPSEPEPTPEVEAQADQGEKEPQPSSGDAAPSSASDVSAYVTPLVRKLAAQHHVDLSSVEGTGVGGRIRKQDVLAAAEAAKSSPEPEPEPAPAPSQASSAPAAASAPSGANADTLAAVAAKRGSREKMSRLRKVIAQRMVESLQVSAQLTTVVEVDVTKVARLRTRSKAEFEQREGVKLSFMPFFALAAIEALKLHPIVNASIENEEIVYHAQENLGVAVDTERGLIVPVIKDAGDLNIAGLARKIADLAERTRTNKVTPDELGGGTFTLTNTGSRGALFDTPILNQPQVGILGTGSVVKRPVVVTDEDGGETIAIRSMVYLALSYDHRIVDGADAARFLGTIKARLEEASFEV